MNILVCISSVPDTTSPINFNNNIFESDLIKLIINLKSFFFSDLVIIDNLFIQEPKFFIDILKKKPNEKGDTANTIFDDNIGLAKESILSWSEKFPKRKY